MTILSPGDLAHLQEVAKRPDAIGAAAHQRIVESRMQAEIVHLRDLLRRLTEHAYPMALEPGGNWDGIWAEVRREVLR